MPQTKTATKEVTLCLPPKLVVALAEIYPDVHLSEQIRRVLSHAEVYAEVDLTSIRVPYAEGKRKNYYLPVSDFKRYDFDASTRGQSVSGYLINLLANVLAEEGYLDLPPRWENPLIPFEVTNPAPIPRFEFSHPLIKRINDQGVFRPFDVDWVTQVILMFVRDGLEGNPVEVSVRGYYFHQRHNKEKESMKVRISPSVDNILLQVANRMGSTRNMVLTQALLYYFSKL